MANNMKGKTKAIPIIKERIIKNPQTLFPVNWEERLDEGEYWYEEEPIFDKAGNCTIKKNLFIVDKQIVGFYRPKRKRTNSTMQKPLFELKGDAEENGKDKSSPLH